MSERTSLEISLATLRGVAAFHVLGAGDEARAPFSAPARSSPTFRRIRCGVSPAAGARICAHPAGGVRRGTCHRGSCRCARLANRAIRCCARRQHRAWTRLHAAGPPARVPRIARARAARTSRPTRALSSGATSPTRRSRSSQLLSLPLAHLGLIGQARDRLRAGVRASPPAGAADGTDGGDLVRRAAAGPSWRRGRRGRDSRMKCAHSSTSSHSPRAGRRVAGSAAGQMPVRETHSRASADSRRLRREHGASG